MFLTIITIIGIVIFSAWAADWAVRHSTSKIDCDFHHVTDEGKWGGFSINCE